MRSAKIERHVHVVLDHHDGHVARNGQQQLAHVLPLVDRQAGERLVEQQHFRILRQRHGDLDAPAFAVGGLRQRPVGDVVETDARRARRAPARQVRLADRSAHHGFQRSGDSPSKASVTLRSMVSRANSVMI